MKFRGNQKILSASALWLIVWAVFLFSVSCKSKGPASEASSRTQNTSDAAAANIPAGVFGDLGNGFYLNPIFPGDYPDPTVIRDGADYYMTHTPHDNKPGLIVWHSRDLVNWEAIGCALTHGTGEIWAPDFVKYKGKFYIYFPNQTTHSNCVVTADNPAGPWSEPTDLKVGHIDPGHVVGENGNRYLYFSDGHMVQLAEDGLSTVGEVRKVYDGWNFPGDWLVECFCLEAPKLVRKGNYFYLISAEGGTSGPATSHMVVVARSKSVFGPWENSPYNPLIHTRSSAETWWSKGHASLIDTPGGDWYAVYHAYKNNRRTRGRMTLLEPIEWTADGWPRLPEGSDLSRPIPMPEGENVGSTIDLHEDFKTDFENHRWQATGGWDPDRYVVSADSLRMKSLGEKPEDSRPLLFQVHHDRYEAAVEVRLDGAGERGLMLYYGPGCYLGCALGPDGIYRVDERGREKIAALPAADFVDLKIVNDDQSVGFYFSADGAVWTTAGDAVDVSPFQTNLLHDFRSLRIALLFCGGGKTTAEFRDFSYQPMGFEK
jgi:xylan 1,4-beta-xylosidase